MARNPRWTSDELILALDLYFRAGRIFLDATHPEVVRLSEELNSLSEYSEDIKQKNFRNPNGVSMKLGNFMAIDPQNDSGGLGHSARMDKVIWDEYSNDPQRLNMTAESIIALYDNPKLDYLPDILEEDTDCKEGKILRRMHKVCERDSRIVKRKKQEALTDSGYLKCEVCGFIFRSFYGSIGEGFIECHHIIPLHTLKNARKTTLADLALVCANCHRMLHKSNPMWNISEIKEIIKVIGKQTP